ncbi:MAG: hypothetical protein WCP39_05070 [Chlamydiota bacterium]
MLRKWIALFFIGTSLFGLENIPWFGNVYELYFTSKYAFSRYTKVNRALPTSHYRSNDNLLYFDLDFPFSSNWSVDGDVDFFGSSKQKFNFRSGALQLRYLLLDDIVGDPVSISIGVNVRGVSQNGLYDVSTPYHGRVEGQVHFAIGKEFAHMDEWKFRIWGFGNLGFSSTGSPWLKEIFSMEGNIEDTHLVGTLVEAMQGYGKRDHVYIDHFQGYGKYRQRIIDVSLWYGRRFGEWGSLRLEYKRRVFARVAPAGVNTFAITYMLPFSF